LAAERAVTSDQHVADWEKPRHATPSLTVNSHMRTVVARYGDCLCVKIAGRLEAARRSLVLRSAAREKRETPGAAPDERGHAGCVLAGSPVRLRPVAGRPSGRTGELSARSWVLGRGVRREGRPAVSGETGEIRFGFPAAYEAGKKTRDLTGVFGFLALLRVAVRDEVETLSALTYRHSGVMRELAE
jgi:hypothetical protein